MTEKSIVPLPISARELTLEKWAMIKEIAETIAHSRGLSVSQAIMVMATGYEMGFMLIESLDMIEWVEGRLSIKPKGQMALVHASGIIETKIERLTDKTGAFFGVRCKMRRTDNGFEYERTFTLEDARRAHLTEGSPTKSGVRGYGNWEKYPENMCSARAVGFTADWVLPTSRRLYFPEELESPINEDGEIIKITEIDPKTADNTPTTATQTADVSPKTEVSTVVESPKKILVQDIIAAGFTAEQIMAANEGRISATSEDCETVLGKLKNDAT